MTNEQSSQQAPVAILGYGTAAVNALIALRTSGYQGKVQVFTDTEIPPYSPILTSYYAAGRKAYEQCFPWTDDDLASLDAEVHGGHPVDQLDVEGHVVRTAEGEFPYCKCVIATGARPMRYGFPQIEGYEPMVLRTMDDAQRLKDALDDPACKRVLVSGASMVALKSLEAALDHGKQVTLVGMAPQVLDVNALPEAAKRFEKGLAEKGVELKLGTVISEVDRVADSEGFGGYRLEVTFKNGDTGTFDEITVAHGMRSNLEFLTEGALEIDRALVVDEFMRTSNPDVYAAGDVAQGLELVSGQKRVVGIWKNAAVQGFCAGKAIAAELAGKEPLPADAFKGAIATNTIAVNGTLFISAGALGNPETRTVVARETEDMLVLYIYEGEQLVGFNLVCDHDVPGSEAYDIGAMLCMRIEAGCH